MEGIATTGRYGPFGGVYVPETLWAPVAEVDRAFRDARSDPAFRAELDRRLAVWAGRPTPCTEVPRFAERIGAGETARIFLKREDLLHTGAHKINNALGQCLLARRMGKSRVIAETGAGQHGVATAAAAAALGLSCRVYMGTEDMRRQRLNVVRMRLFGAEVTGVESGSRTLKDAINEAMRDWVTNVRTTHYCLGSVLGPHPYPAMIRFFHEVIGAEAKAQLSADALRPDLVVACVGGGSNAIGIFSAFLDDPAVALVGVEAGGRGAAPGEHAARIAGGGGRRGVLHGCETLLLADDDGNILPTHSVSAGLDYPAIGPAHAALAATGRATYTRVGDDEALAAFRALAETEGILPALESSHALAEVARRGGALAGKVVLVNLSGRGDKDVDEAARLLEIG